MIKVLLIEDEAKLLRSLAQGLQECQISADTASDGVEGLALALKNTYAVIVSDVIMPGKTGIELLRELRMAGNQTPVLLLTALNQTDDKLIGFDAGADDYLTKPFEFNELLARIRAMSRRKANHYQPQSLRFADLELNFSTKELFRSGKKISLTPREFSLMEYLMRHPGRVISKLEISEKVWDLDFDTGTNVIEVYVNFLRKKIDRDFPKKLIHTQFKIGYILKEQEDETNAD
jgi:two-component system, OmpR family, copper resistance phosphate regulon response regulator CusR